MSTRSSRAAATELRFAQEELEAALGPLKPERCWHRLEERVCAFNRKGRSLGIKLSTCRAKGELVVTAGDAETLERFRESLGGGIGRVQRAVAALLGRRLSAQGALDPFEALYERQAAGWALSARRSLQSLPGVGPLTGDVFIPPPFRLEGAARARSALDAVVSCAREAGRPSLAVLGPSGVGKSTLLLQGFRSLKPLAPRGPVPVHLCAFRLRFHAGGPFMPWEEAVPGGVGGLGERLDALLAGGRLVLFLDGLDENPRLLDCADDAVWSFWTQAARNRCLIACRDGYFLRHLHRSPIHRLFDGALASLHLLPWTPAHAAQLYGRVASAPAVSAGGALPAAAAQLVRMPPDALRGRLGSIRLTGLSAWGYALFFARRGRLPRNEFEILDHLNGLLVDWERERFAGDLPEDVAHGLLCRIGWRAYQNAFQDGTMGDTTRIGAEEILEVVRRDYPLLAERGHALAAALARMPFLSYDGSGASYVLERAFACFLAAKHLLGLGLRGDAEGLREAFKTPLTHDPTESLYQALELLDGASRQRWFQAGRDAFESASRAFRGDGDPREATCMQGLLQPMARLGLEEVRVFLRGLQGPAERLPELARLSAARALAHLGDSRAVESHLRRLRGDARAREINRGFYLYWLKDGRPTRGGADWLRGLRVEGWERTCRWFLRQLCSRDAAPLRAIHLFTFCDLIETLGAASADPAELRRLAGQLDREAAAHPSLRRDLLRLRGLLRGLSPRERPAAILPTAAHEAGRA